MEVAGQWRREWAGTAEYGKITEGGVTRRVARALEVLNASGPGAQVRVMRAAYHSSAGPGAPTSSYMMHSSRQFISSGSRLLTSPSLIQMSKPLEITSPLEISSTPLDVSPDDGTDTENYKVTEPDDFEISEPSKWKSSTRSSHLVVPSEESSSTDNASIIELDSRNNSLRRNNNWRRHSYDSENSDVPKSRSRTQSPLLENPVTLSTLKYKSLLNNSNDSWNNRRKSYSFEDTKPSDETMLHNKEKIAMESSTDSGICKSTEIVNETIDERDEHNYYESEQENNTLKEESFKDWLARNRSNNVPKVYNIKVNRDYGSKSPIDRVGLQSTKVSIALTNEPVKVIHKVKDDDDLKRTKRVEFCKTELHFAAESGTVNIISTDEKPPPSNDFRKRRSAFVPIQSNYDKPITLFGDKFDDLLVINGSQKPLEKNGTSEVDSDENTAATKSILKNKIPKPKPYLLGENMDFGENKVTNTWESTRSKPSAVIMINKQLEMEPMCVKKTAYECREKFNTPNKERSSTNDYKTRRLDDIKSQKDKDDNETTFKQTLRTLQSSPILQPKSRTRLLKESDLTYFGVDTKVQRSDKKLDEKHNFIPIKRHSVDDMFNAVRLVQQASYNTSRMDKDDYESDYQNIPITLEYTPVPITRKFKNNNIFTTYEENEKDITEKTVTTTRTSRLKNSEVSKYDKSRSISEPPKHRITNPMVQSNIKEIGSKINKINHEIIAQQNRNSPVSRSGENSKNSMKNKKPEKHQSESNKYNENKSTTPQIKTSSRHKQSSPIYVNLDNKSNSNTTEKHKKYDISGTQERKSRCQTKKSDLKAEENTPSRKKETHDHQSNKSEKNCKIRDSQSTLISQQSYKNNSVGKSSEDTKSIGKEISKRQTVKEQSGEKSKSIHRTDDKTKLKRESNDKHAITKSNGVNTSTDQKKRSHSYDRKENLNGYSDTEYKRNKKHREEYVINYDDKNGTFASINKIKHRPKSPDKVKINSSRKKQEKKETNDKNSLLQYLHQSKQNGLLQDSKRKWKSKVYVQRTCQLL